ncbi:hypothetical protein HMF8227_02342 [Saliniradius amylolyticus]|uniref:Uncharacterized protein n=1 Tax=Saliniradius amylolyticus TaxID=2183582 RepID=A0A2S2E564_9ALTE|nr:hypothetical protein [Saliniradius amylolyticus]AWL12794.1 hypothetical protein HMF8227_02342 [Saliniradius amylolyticus]
MSVSTIAVIILALIACLCVMKLDDVGRYIRAQAIRWLYRRAPFFHAHQLLQQVAEHQGQLPAELQAMVEDYSRTVAASRKVELDQDEYWRLLEAERLVQAQLSNIHKRMDNESRAEAFTNIKTDMMVWDRQWRNDKAPASEVDYSID